MMKQDVSLSRVDICALQLTSGLYRRICSRFEKLGQVLRSSLFAPTFIAKNKMSTSGVQLGDSQFKGERHDVSNPVTFAFIF